MDTIPTATGVDIAPDPPPLDPRVSTHSKGRKSSSGDLDFEGLQTSSWLMPDMWASFSQLAIGLGEAPDLAVNDHFREKSAGFQRRREAVVKFRILGKIWISRYCFAQNSVCSPLYSQKGLRPASPGGRKSLDCAIRGFPRNPLKISILNGKQSRFHPSEIVIGYVEYAAAIVIESPISLMGIASALDYEVWSE